MPRVSPTLNAVLLAVGAVGWLHAGTADRSLLRGTVAVIDGTAIPPGARLRVSLRDLTPGMAKDATVATQTFEVEGKSPIHFELPYNDTAIDQDRLYGAAAIVTDSRGSPLWETRVPIRVLTLGNQKKVDLLLRPTDRPKPPPEPTSFGVECDGLRFHVNLNGASATIALPESRVVLPRTDTSSSKRYSDGVTTLAISGSAAYFQLPGKAYRDCKVQPDTPPPAGK